MKSHAWIATALLLAPSLALAATACPDNAPSQENPGRMSLRMDNDAFGSASQDHGYSNGLALAVVSPDLVQHEHACLPLLSRNVNRYLQWAHPEGFEQQNAVSSISHGIYTPDDKTRSDLIAEDRPYAGVLLLGVGYNARSGDRLQTTHLRMGMVGPSAKGQEVQNAVHRVIDVRRAQGWEHQLRDEPLLQVVHERMHRWQPRASSNADGWGWDVIGHAGGSLGNFATHANTGAELRFGWRVPDDFGSNPLRPAGEHSASRSSGSNHGGWTWHAFVSLEGRAVLRDITLDGNTFKSSHSVDKEPLVADLGYGAAVTRGRWKVTLAQYQRSREFEDQLEPPSFGSLSVSRAF